MYSNKHKILQILLSVSVTDYNLNGQEQFNYKVYVHQIQTDP